MLQVVNPFRPFTDTVEGCLKIGMEIEKAAKIPVTGIVGNANMMDETNEDQIREGYEFVLDLEKRSGLELAFVTAPINLLPRLDLQKFSHPVLPIRRQLAPPWLRSQRLSV